MYLFFIHTTQCPGQQWQRRRGRRMRLRARGGDRQEAPAAAATARKPMPTYSEWPDEAQKITTTLYNGCGDDNHTAIASRGYVAPTALNARFEAVLLMCRPYGA